MEVYIVIAFWVGIFICALWFKGKIANEWAKGYEAGYGALEDMEDPADAYRRGYIDSKEEDSNPFLLTDEELDRAVDAAMRDDPTAEHRDDELKEMRDR